MNGPLHNVVPIMYCSSNITAMAEQHPRNIDAATSTGGTAAAAAVVIDEFGENDVDLHMF